MYQGASQRSQLSQNSSTNYFPEFLHPVIFPLNFQSRTLHARQLLDTAFSITISVPECSLRLPWRENPPGFFKGFPKLSAKKAKQTTCSKKKTQTISSHSPFSDRTEKKTPLLHSSKGGSAFAIHWVVEEKQCSDHKTHKSLCTQQFAHFQLSRLV